MITLGVSIYPEKESLEEIEAYLALASSYGFTKVFTSMFSIEGSIEEVLQYFKEVIRIAKNNQMFVTTDINHMYLEEVGASPKDISLFKELGITTLRLDYPYNDERDVELVNNEYDIRIEFNTTMLSTINNVIAKGANVSNLATCHNFYPQRYTGVDLDKFKKSNEEIKELGIPITSFISSQAKDTHGPWASCKGLPTVELHRSLPIELQLQHLLLCGNIDEVIIGNAFASEEEFIKIKEVLDYYRSDIEAMNPFDLMVQQLIPNIGMRKCLFKVEIDKDCTEVEKEILLNYKMHVEAGDSSEYMLRSRFPRFRYKEEELAIRKVYKDTFVRGDVVIVNECLGNYKGEIQIVKKEMEVDGDRNYLGSIHKDYLCLVDEIKEGDVFTFKEEN